jgi:outer membrane protein N
MKKLLSITSVALLSGYLPVAQALELFNDEKSRLDFKGNLSIYYIDNGESSEINDGFSRYTFDMAHQMKDDWQALALLEWGVQLSRTDDQIFVSNNGLTSTGPTTDTTWLRLGYVGVQHESYGRFTIGKQWGVSYDVGGVTDYFEVFGASAQGTYNFGTDGGFSGTGRAEQAIQYKVNYQNISFGAQYLVSDDVISTDNTTGDADGFSVKFNDSYGFSVIYQAPYDIGLGFAYNKAQISLVADVDQIPNPIQSPKVDDELITAHMTYRTYGSLGLHVALVFTDMTNHETNDAGKVMNQSNGIELMSTYRFDNDISLVFGYNSLKDKSNTIISGYNNYHLNYYILSAKYHWDEDFYLYIESKIDDSTLVGEESSLAENATGLGMMYVF